MQRNGGFALLFVLLLSAVNGSQGRQSPQGQPSTPTVRTSLPDDAGAMAANTPKWFPASEVPRIIARLPKYSPFGFSGAAYFQGSLYLGSNIGLLKITNGALSGLYRLHKHDTVSGPWFDRANQLLWLLDDHTNKLVVFDGSTWRQMSMPRPVQGYYSRGDVLEGISPASDNHGFWIVAAQSIWRWSSADRHWLPENAPERIVSERSVITGGAVIGMLPIPGGPAYIVRHQGLTDPSPKLPSDTIDVAAGSGWRQFRPAGVPFFPALWTVANSTGYVCDQNGAMFTVTADKVERLQAPGMCEALSVEPGGSLIASFRSLGVFRLQDANWQSLSSSISGSGQGDYWTYLAAADGEIAYVMSAMPVVDQERSRGDNMRWKRNAPTAVRIIRASQATQVELK